MWRPPKFGRRWATRKKRSKRGRKVERVWSKEQAAAFYQSYEWATKRYEILRKYGARCMVCGASPKDGKTIINVDHIIPLRCRPDLRLDDDNLQCACQLCNKGKSDIYRDDWRSPAHPHCP